MLHYTSFKKIQFIRNGRYIVLGGGKEEELVLVDAKLLKVVSTYTFNNEKIIDYSISSDEESISAITYSNKVVTWGGK